MGRDGLLDACLFRLVLDHDQDHHPCQMLAVAVQEHIVLLARLDRHVTAVVEPELQFLNGLFRDGHQPFLRAFAHHPDKLLVDIQVRQLQVHQLADAQPTGEEHLDDGAVTVALPFREVYRVLQPVHLFRRQHLGQVVAYLRRLQQLCGVVVAVAVYLEVAEEGAHAAEYAALRPRSDADVVESCGKRLEVLELHGRGA